MYINSLQYRIRNGQKFPIPLENESYYHRHQPVNFTIKLLNNQPMTNSANGTIFLTDKRIIFIAYKTGSDVFENFYVMLSDIVSSVTAGNVLNNLFYKNTFSVNITLRDKTIFNMSITYDYDDIEQKRIFEDYYGMLISWATKNKPGKPLSISTQNSNFTSEGSPMSPYYNSWSMNSPSYDGEQPPPYS
ncbi:858_t:CDS:1 [Scutellospora calospora]|uniref:858_t:CDS:1 n=1 Tax=Scutellospora calospora TaxID=85575 RepID=A0ACA9LRY1_9GLOM|nr:858_t:CDS:1 [Scutellospora calospora]